MLRQFLAEGFILVLLGAGLGVLLAQGGLKLIMAAAPDSVPRTGEIKIDLLVLAFTLGVSVLAVVLVVGSGLMIRAFWKLRSVDIGFNPFGVLSFTVALPPSAYPVPAQLQFSQSLPAKLASIPGVKSASIAGGLPPLRPINANDTGIEGYQPTPGGPARSR
jgi:hypothetical protein